MEESNLTDATHFKTGWLTINRECNLCCSWCYASDVDHSAPRTVSLANSRRAIRFFGDLGIRRLILIGGEPTCHDELEEIVRFASELEMAPTIFTNGILLSSLDRCIELKVAGLHYVNLSLKGCNRAEYEKITGFDEFGNSLKAIANLRKIEQSFCVSMVLTSGNADEVLDGILAAQKNGATNFHFSLEYDCSGLSENKTVNCVRGIDAFSEVSRIFEEIYEDVHKLTKGLFTLDLSHPLCLWDREVLTLMEQRSQVNYACHILRRPGLTLDSSLSIIPCNAFYKTRLGTLGKDFANSDEFLRLWRSPKVEREFADLQKAPDNMCLSCCMYEKCRGGCPINWYNFDYTQLELAKRWQ